MKPVVTLTTTAKQSEKTSKTTFDLLWVGKLDVRKQLALAIKAIATLQVENLYLHIVGSGAQTSYKALATELGVKHQCIWHGSVSHNEVQTLMQQSDILFFTSVAEGTPHVVLEAIGNQLPVLCFDCCGQGDSVDETVGIKIPLSNPRQSVREFAEKIEYLYHHRDVLKTMSRNCIQRQQILSWDKKACQMVALYYQALENHAKTPPHQSPPHPRSLS